jgi:hypothetical protein
VIDFRKAHQVWLYAHEKLAADDYFYAFARGDATVCLSNANTASVTRTLTSSRFADGTLLCDATSTTERCVTVQNGQFDCTVADGLPTLLSPRSQSGGV